MKTITSEIYEELHSCCPVCGNDMLLVTMIGVPEYDDKDYIDEMNIAQCEPIHEKFDDGEEINNKGCGWIGKVDELVARK